MKKSLPKSSGFTLIELIVVIVILGIMAAVAGPKFIDLQSDARKAVLDGVIGSVKSAATLVYSKSLIDGTENSASGSTVTLQNATVDIIYGYPSEADLLDALDLSSDISYATTTGVFTLRTNCTATYTEATSTTSASIVLTLDTGC